MASVGLEEHLEKIRTYKGIGYCWIEDQRNQAKRGQSAEAETLDRKKHTISTGARQNA